MTERRPHSEGELIEHVRGIDVPAPAHLHERVRALVDDHARARGRRGPGWLLSPLRVGLASAAALVAIVAAIVAGLSGSNGGPSLSEAATLTLRPATLAAPAESTRDRSQLSVSVQGVAFPYWGERFGWRSSGARTDTIGGRSVTTVFYAGAGRRVGYAIVSGPAPKVSGGTLSWRGHTPYRVSDRSGVHVVSWVRDGHLCVVSGRGVAAATLLRLASWDEPGTPA